MFFTIILVFLAWSGVDCLNVDPIARNLLDKMVGTAPQYLSTFSRDRYPWTQIPGTSFRNDPFGVDVKFKSGRVSSVDAIELSGETSTTMIGSSIYITIPITSHLVIQHDVTCLMHCTAFGATSSHNVTVVNGGTLDVEFEVEELSVGEKCNFESYKMKLNSPQYFAITSSHPNATSSESCDYYLPHPVTNELRLSYYKDTEKAVEEFFLGLANEVFVNNNLCPQNPF